MAKIGRDRNTLAFHKGKRATIDPSVFSLRRRMMVVAINMDAMVNFAISARIAPEPGTVDVGNYVILVVPRAN